MPLYSTLPLKGEYPTQTNIHRPWSPVHGTNNHNHNHQQEVSDSSFEVFGIADYEATLRDRDQGPSLLLSPRTVDIVVRDRVLPTRSTSALIARPSQQQPPTPTYASPTNSRPYVSPWAPLSDNSYQPAPSYTSHAQWPLQNGASTSSHTPSRHDLSSERVDVMEFPAWSRPWFEKNTGSQPSQSPVAFSPSINSQYRASAPHFDLKHHGTFVPWAGDINESSPYVSQEVKEARMRALQDEFGKDTEEPFEGRDVVGGIDAKGNIVTDSPRKRATTRFCQVLLVVGIVISSLYAAIILKPNGAPPPRGSVASYLLYVLSVLTCLLLFYVLFIRPCFRHGKRKNASFTGEMGGVMVLPVQGFPGAGKKGKKGKKDSNESGVHVNLIMDTSKFGQRDDTAESNDSNSQFDGRSKRTPRRVGILEGLRKEEQWRIARSQLKRQLTFDVLLLIIWATEFMIILVGKRCPPGKFDGWCDSYNTATALACFLVIAFSFSVYFGIKDLHSSKASPRTRT